MNVLYRVANGWQWYFGYGVMDDYGNYCQLITRWH